MADLSKIRLNGTVYNFKDAEARLLIATLPNATASTHGLMSAQDKQVLDNLNPNISVTISNIMASETHVINAKQENLLGLRILELPQSSEQIRTSNLLNVNDETCEPGYLSSSGTLMSSTNSNDTAGPYMAVTPGQDIYYTGTVGQTVSSSINRRLHVYNANKQWIKQLSYHGNLKIGDSWSTHGVIPSNGAYVRVSWGVTDYNVMISVGSPVRYEPYYITPFSAISSSSFQLASNEEYTNAVTYTTTVPAAAGALYGFEYDPVLGKIYKTTEHIASYNGETLPDTIWYSDRDVYDSASTPSNGAEVIYVLDDEDIVEYDITPTVIPLNYQTNYFFTNTGLIKSITYYAETLAVNHITLRDGITFGEIDILENNVANWNNAATLIDTKADITSPAFLGAPTAPTPGINANNTRLATTEFVQTKMGNLAYIESTNKASQNYEVGDYLMCGGILYKVTAAIAKNATLTPNSNMTATTVATELNLLKSLIS